MSSETRPLVTIGMPTYNRADGYLREALESALSQTYPNLEIIVSDNCSTDDTGSLVESYRDPRIRYIRQEHNLAPNDNFNFCLNQAKGAYFLLLHDDDKIDSDFVEACMRAADYATDIGVIRTGAHVIDGNGEAVKERPNNEQGYTTAELFSRWLDSKALMLFCSTLFNTELLKKAGGFNSKHQRFQDVLAEFKLAARHGRVDVREPKASFRKHPEQQTFSAGAHEWAEDSLVLLDTMCELAPESETLIREKGEAYFSRFNYGIASGIPSPVERYKNYLSVYRMFGYRYSPLRFFFNQRRGKLKVLAGRT